VHYDLREAWLLNLGTSPLNVIMNINVKLLSSFLSQPIATRKLPIILKNKYLLHNWWNFYGPNLQKLTVMTNDEYKLREKVTSQSLGHISIL